MSHRLNVLVATPLGPENVAVIESAVSGIEVAYRPDLLPVPRYEGDHEGQPHMASRSQNADWEELLRNAEVLLGLDFPNGGRLNERAPSLRWVQGTSSGMATYVVDAGLLETDVIVTTAAGIHGRPLAEFVLLAALYFTKDMPQLQSWQRAHHWQRCSFRELHSARAGILGLGSVGSSVAAVLSRLGVQVVGRRRTYRSEPAEGVSRVLNPKEWDSMLPTLDFLVVAVPATPETYHMVGRRELALLPPQAVLINIGRGSVVDEEALVEALRNGRLAGAALDVFENEPLPGDSPLWEMSNVIISPHSASTVRGENRRLAELFVENLHRFVAGKTLINVFDRRRLY